LLPGKFLLLIVLIDFDRDASDVDSDDQMMTLLLMMITRLKITAGQRTMTGQNKHLTGQMSFEI